MYESLSIFGENTETALLSHLEKEGIGFTAEQFDMNKFCIIAEQLMGNSADFIFVKILDEFCRQSKVSIEEMGLSHRAPYLTQSDKLVALYSKASE